MKVTAIVGSPRPSGNTSCLVDYMLEELATQGLEVEKIILSQHRVNPCLGHEDCASFPTCQQDDDARWILDKFINSEGVILGSPVYYYDMTAQMKAFIDRNYFLYTHGIPYRASCAGLVVIAGGAGIEYTVGALRRFVGLLDNISDERIITLTGYASSPGEVKNNPALIEKARKLGKRMSEILSSSS